MSQRDILEDKKEREDFYIALGVILLAFGFILSFVWDRDGADGPQSFDAQMVPTTVQQEPVIVEEPVRGATNVDHYDWDRESKGTKSSDPLSMDIVIVSSDSAVETYLPIPSDVNHHTSKELEVVGHVGEEEVQDSLLRHRDPVISDSPTIKKLQVETCTIAIGLYKEDRNVQKQLRRLREAGLDAYAQPLNRMTKVSVRTRCDLATSQLKMIQSRFAKDAFVE